MTRKIKITNNNLEDLAQDVFKKPFNEMFSQEDINTRIKSRWFDRTYYRISLVFIIIFGIFSYFSYFFTQAQFLSPQNV